MILLPNGTVKAWGANLNGELGIGSTTSQTTPQQIPASNLSSVWAIAAGSHHSLALLSTGTVKAWGLNQYGQLGLGNTSGQNLPQQIPASSLGGVIAIAAGDCHSLALLSNGTVMAWGCNQFGELGLGNSGLGAHQATPQQIPASNLSNVVAIAAGHNHSLALLSNGTVKTWGINQYGELGLGYSGMATNQSTPQQIPSSSLNNVVAIEAGGAHNLALHSNSNVTAWGLNGTGQLGLANTTNQIAPLAIPSNSLSNVVALAAGASHSFALLADGTVKAWGDNYFTQLGMGIIPFPGVQTTPIQIASSNLSNVSALAAGNDHSVATLSDGTATSWGRNIAGQLGLGSTANQSTPQPIPWHCFSAATTFSMHFEVLGSSALGMTIPCNPVTSIAGGPYYYFNSFSADSLNSTSPGTGAWHGLHTTQAEVLAWLNWGTNGFAVALGPLASTGGAAASVAITPGSLSGLTVYGVSVAFHPLTLAVLANSSVTGYTF